MRHPQAPTPSLSSAASKEAEPEAIDLPTDLREEVSQRMGDLAAALSLMIARINRRAGEIAEGRVAEAMRAAHATSQAAESELAHSRQVIADMDKEMADLQTRHDAALAEIEKAEQTRTSLLKQIEVSMKAALEREGRLTTQLSKAQAERKAAETEAKKATAEAAELRGRLAALTAK